MKIKPFLKYFILTLILLLLLAGGYFAISYYRSLKSPVLSAYNAIPQSTALFAEFTDPSRLMDKLTDGSPLWSEFLSVKSIFDFQQNVLKLDSLISEDSQINGIIHSRKTVVCICCADSIAGALFLCELPSTGYESVIKSFITRVNSEKSIVMQKKSGKGTISLVNIPGIRSFFNFSVYKGLFIGSFRESLVKEAIKQLESGIPVNTDENFKKLEITAGKNVDANIYLNYPEFTRLVSTVAGNDFLNRLSYLSSFSQWTGADLIVKPDELFINGYTVCSGSENHWLNVMEQEPQNILLPEILPSGISFFVHWGLEDYGRFQTSLKEYRKSIEKESHREQHSKALKKELGLDIEEEFISWAGHEIALATEGSQGLPGNGKYVVIHAADIVKAKESLGKLSEKSIAGTGEKPFILKFEEYEIRKVRIREMFPFLFGELFGGMECPFYTTMRDYVVFADTPEALTHLIRSYYDQKTLAENTGYRSFSNNISEKSNVYVYCNIRNSIQGITGLLEKTAAEKFMTNPAAFRNLDGLSLQFSHIGDMFYTSMYLRYNPSIEEEIPSGWVAELTGNVTGKPYFTRNDETGKLNVLAFDDQSNMYRLDHFGKIIWKTPLIELPVSEVFQLAKDGASSQQYLFNTENYVYLMDGSGNYIDGYPAKLTPGATNGLTLLDNEGNKNYRMVLALSDNRIYDYNLNLVQSEGWYKITARGKVNLPVEYLSSNKKDYLFITDESGNVTICGKTGRTAISLKKEFQKAEHSKFYVNKTNSKGLFLTTDVHGKLVYINENGRTDRTDFGDYSPDHFFLYEDFSQNGSKDFIFLDQNKLKVFDRFKKIVLEFEFPENIDVEPVFFSNLRDQFTLGVVSAAEGKIYLFNKDGLLYADHIFSGSLQFIVGSLNSDGKLNLITGLGNRIVNYVME